MIHLVSVIIPCYNEEATIRLMLQALLGQSYPREALEVVIADGLSTDRTREEVAAFKQQNPDLALRVVDNPRKNIPAGLNIALAAARGSVIVRMDAHSVPCPDYIARCVADLEEGLGDNVGGVWDIRAGGPGWIARSIAAVAAHPLGVGDARYRYTSQAGAVDTVPFGSFYRKLVERIGQFDESLLTNEDYEFNVRVRRNGGKVWLDPAIRCEYYAREDLAALARQYWRYGYWKQRMLRRYPGTIRWRQALPPLFVLSILVLIFLAVWLPIARLALALGLALYCLVLFLAGLQLALCKKSLFLLIGVPLGIATMHVSWGSGFLWSLIRGMVGR
jgi:succinoglycan biosynthesis protein ExoA